MNSLGPMQIAILDTIDRSNGIHGMQIRTELQSREERRVSDGQVYVALRRLSDRNAVKSTLVKTSGRGRPRRVYCLTDDGRKMLANAESKIYGAAGAAWRDFDRWCARQPEELDSIDVPDLTHLYQLPSDGTFESDLRIILGYHLVYDDVITCGDVQRLCAQIAALHERHSPTKET